MLDSDSLAPCSQNYIQAGSAGFIMSPEPYRISVVIAIQQCLTVTVLTIMKIIEKLKKIYFTVVPRDVA